jgi:hypothetical protein
MAAVHCHRSRPPQAPASIAGAPPRLWKLPHPRNRALLHRIDADVAVSPAGTELRRHRLCHRPASSSSSGQSVALRVSYWFSWTSPFSPSRPVPPPHRVPASAAARLRLRRSAGDQGMAAPPPNCSPCCSASNSRTRASPHPLHRRRRSLAGRRPAGQRGQASLADQV